MYSDKQITSEYGGRYQVCDGVDNCGDGSDENNMTLCAARAKPCEPYAQFQCANRRCVARAQLCDLADDCGDASDERGCHHAHACTLSDKGAYHTYTHHTPSLFSCTLSPRPRLYLF